MSIASQTRNRPEASASSTFGIRCRLTCEIRRTSPLRHAEWRTHVPPDHRADAARPPAPAAHGQEGDLLAVDAVMTTTARILIPQIRHMVTQLSGVHARCRWWQSSRSPPSWRSQELPGLTRECLGLGTSPARHQRSLRLVGPAVPSPFQQPGGRFFRNWAARLNTLTALQPSGSEAPQVASMRRTRGGAIALDAEGTGLGGVVPHGVPPRELHWSRSSPATRTVSAVPLYSPNMAPAAPFFLASSMGIISVTTG